MVFVNSTLDFLVKTYKNEIQSGYLDLVVPTLEYYPDFKKFTYKDEIFNDSSTRIKWRTKQNLDITYLMSYCFDRSEFYLHVIF